jgi:hypothetical protein
VGVPIVWMCLGRRRDIGGVAIVPDIALVSKVIEADDSEDYSEEDYPRSSCCRHLEQIAVDGARFLKSVTPVDKVSTFFISTKIQTKTRIVTVG